MPISEEKYILAFVFNLGCHCNSVPSAELAVVECLPTITVFFDHMLCKLPQSYLSVITTLGLTGDISVFTMLFMFLHCYFI